MEKIHTFVSSGDIAAITCPKCRVSRHIPIGKYKNRRHTIKVKCSCEHSFIVQLDFRRHYRKETKLAGSYAMLPPATGTGRLYILNISKSGIGFTVGTMIHGFHTIVPGQQMNINFQLDDKKATGIEKVITVRTVEENYVGGEFVDIKAFEKDLGFYLRP